MKKNMVIFMASVSIAALFAGGCANKEVVKKADEVAPQTIAEPKVEPAKPTEETKPVEPAKPAVVKPAQEESAKPASQPEKTVVNDNKFEAVYFDFDKSTLRQDARDVLSKNAETILKSFAGAKVQIEGHCDERGSAEYNLALGENRAKSAQKYLTTLGVKPENLSIISYGKEKPAVNGSNEAAWAKNRRDEFVVTK
jgi:peptidoglycan-associated lipoprotein